MKLFCVSLVVVIAMIGLEICVEARQNNNYRNYPNSTYSGQKTVNHTRNSLSQYPTQSRTNKYNNTNTQIVPTNMHTSYQTPRPAVMAQQPVYYPPPGGYVPVNVNYNNNNYRPSGITPNYTVPNNNYISYPIPSPALKQMPAVLYLPAGPTGYYMCHNHGQPVTPFAYPAGYTGQRIVSNVQPQSYPSYPMYGQPGTTGSYVQAAPIPYQQNYGYRQPNASMSYINTVPVRSQPVQNVQITNHPPPYVVGPHSQPCTFIFYPNVAPMG